MPDIEIPRKPFGTMKFIEWAGKKPIITELCAGIIFVKKNGLLHYFSVDKRLYTFIATSLVDLTQEKE